MSQRYAPLVAHIGSAGSLVEITPADDTDLATPVRALWVGGAGDVEVIGADDDDPVTLAAVPAGTLLPIRVKRVRDAGTDASFIIGLL